MQIVDKYKQLSPKVKKIAAIVGIIASIGGALTTVNLVTGVQVRPAWSWEIQTLEKKYQSLLIRQIRTEIREAYRLLSARNEQREVFRASGDPVPTWLTNRISELESDIRDFNAVIETAKEEISD